MIKKFIKKYVIFLTKKIFSLKYFKSFVNIVNKVQFDSYLKIDLNGQHLKFINPNHITDWRIKTLKTKEPETINWIDGFKNDTVFWDIGANIGQFSIYAAKKIKNINVISFEPSVFNLEILARNININHLNNVSIMPLPVFDKIENNYFSLSNSDWGGALSNFGTNQNWEGNSMDTVLSYKTFSFNPKSFITTFNLNYPDYLKIDVDGVDNIILKSFGHNIKSIKSILIEVNDNFESQRNDIESFLNSNNFKLMKKEQSELIKRFPKTFHNSYNQIWTNNDEKTL